VDGARGSEHQETVITVRYAMSSAFLPALEVRDRARWAVKPWIGRAC
jgi:hypothetical protein